MFRTWPSMMDIAKSETFKNFTVLNKALLFLIKLNKTAVQSVPKIAILLARFLLACVYSSANS